MQLIGTCKPPAFAQAADGVGAPGLPATVTQDAPAEFNETGDIIDLESHHVGDVLNPID